MLCNIEKLVIESVVLIYSGRVIADEYIKFNDLINKNYDSKNDVIEIIAIHSSNGGNCLRFVQTIQDSNLIKDEQNMRNSLNFTNKNEMIEEFYKESCPLLENLIKSKFNGCSLESLFAIMLWSSNLIYRELNNFLAKNMDLSLWCNYLKSFTLGLKEMPYFKGTVYRGIKDYRELNLYQKGKTVTWKTISALSKSLQIAESFSNKNGMIFEVEVVNSRDICDCQFILMRKKSFFYHIRL